MRRFETCRTAAFHSSLVRCTDDLRVRPMHMSNFSPAMVAEDGSRLWLRHAPLADPVKHDAVRQIVVTSKSTVASNIRTELQTDLSALLGDEIPIAPAVSEDGALVVASMRHEAALLEQLQWSDQLDLLSDEGFIIRRATIAARRATVIAARTEIGAL